MEILKMMRNTVLTLLGAVLLFYGASAVAGGMNGEEMGQFWLESYGDREELPGKTYFGQLERELLAKAEPDECFYGSGDPLNNYDPNMDPDACRAAGGMAKVNQGYVFGMTKSGDNIWFGTGPNMLCLAMGAYVWPFSLKGGEKADPDVYYYECEYGDSKFTDPPYNMPDDLGDWRPPRIFVYNTQDKTLTEKTPADPLLNDTLGIRSAGTLGNVVLLGGPQPDEGGQVHLFAFNAYTGAYLGSGTLFGYFNIREWLVVDDVLYTAASTGFGGRILRWTGDGSLPFQFEVVGNIGGDPAFLAYHDGRIFVSNWPEIWGVQYASLWMSPSVPPGGLTSAHAGDWTQVWDASDYDPDPIMALTYSGGALASYGGDLYWGTMQVPLVSILAHIAMYGYPATEEDLITAYLGTLRPPMIFRGRNFDTEPEVELLYGMRYLPVYTPDDPFNPQSGGSWEIVANSMEEGGQRPLYGLPGFGNILNTYTWTMKVYDDQLFVGTMDSNFIMKSILEWLFGSLEIPELDLILELLTGPVGADLWRFPSPDLPALPEDREGVGNWSSYGIRCMVSDDALYLGMANPMNLLTDPNDDYPEGGWELIRLGPPPLPKKYVLESGDYDGDGKSDIAIFRRPFGLWAVKGQTRCRFGGIGDAPASGDYDGDGSADIAVFRTGLWAVRNLTRVYYGNVSSESVPSDYNGDGSCDLGVFNKFSGLWSVRGITRAYFGTAGDRPAPGDYDGDGAADLAVFRPSTGEWCLKDMTRFYLGSSWDTIVPGDYDGDGTWEAGVFSHGWGLWAIRGLTRSYYGGIVGRPVPADYDGDSQDDIGVYRGFGSWRVKGVTRTYYGTIGDIPVTR